MILRADSEYIFHRCSRIYWSCFNKVREINNFYIAYFVQLFKQVHLLEMIDRKGTDPNTLQYSKQAMNRLIEDVALRLSMGKAGRYLAEREFSIDKVVDAHLDIYDELLAVRGKIRTCH